MLCILFFSSLNAWVWIYFGVSLIHIGSNMYIYSLKSLISDAEGPTILTSWWWSWLSAAGSLSLSGRSHYTDQYSEQCTSLSALSASNTTVEQVYTETRSTYSNIGTSSSTKTCSCPHRQAKRPVEETNTEPVHRKLSSSRHNGHSWLIQHDKCPKHTSHIQTSTALKTCVLRLATGHWIKY